MSYSNDKPGTPEELLHFGVKGMKWGVRKGGLGSRFKGALDDRNQQKTAVLTRMKEGRTKGLNEKIAAGIGRATSGTKNNYDRRVNKALGKLEDQKKRIDSGKLKTRDILEIFGTVSATDLVFSRRDNKG